MFNAHCPAGLVYSQNVRQLRLNRVNDNIAGKDRIRGIKIHFRGKIRIFRDIRRIRYQKIDLAHQIRKVR